jgi:arylsulfatase A-like enzyme
MTRGANSKPTSPMKRHRSLRWKSASFAQALATLVLVAGPAKRVDAGEPAQGMKSRPNVLLILIDDHAANMISLLDESVVRTPNIERLAARGTWFSRAYNDAPACCPSRTAMFTGVHAAKSGVYYNAQAFRRTKAPISRAETLHGLFLRHGYLTAGFGKIVHTPWQNDNLDDFTPGFRVGHRDKKFVTHTDADLVKFILPETLRVPMPDYLPTRFGALPDDWDRDDPAKLQEDTEHANRTIGFLQTTHGQPFFVTCGFWRPHSERIVPKRYFDMYPLDTIRIPESYRADDLEDVPMPGRRRATNRGTHAAVVNAGLWREYLRSYYAATTYIDEQIGRVLDALEASPYAANTIVILASDNGYNGGEKNMWAKFALWEQTNRVIFGVSVPGLPRQLSPTPVGLIDLYPTLLTLCGLPAPTAQELDGVDLTPLLKGESIERGKPVLSTYGEGNHSIRDWRFRYIRYRNGDEELYDHDNDPHEWTNLAGNPRFEHFKAELARWLPEVDAPEIEPGRPNRPWDGSELRNEQFEEWKRTGVR